MFLSIFLALFALTVSILFYAVLIFGVVSLIIFVFHLNIVFTFLHALALGGIVILLKAIF